MGTYADLQEIVICFLLFLQIGTSVYSQASSQSPMFQGSTVTVTAEAGKTAILPCIVNFVGNHKVAWMDPRLKVLSVMDQRVIHDMRMTIERPVKQEWNLHIRQVRPDDAGEYQCRINTSPTKSKKITLVVSEPPIILKDAGDKDVIEGSTVNLWCKAHGNPEPRITWYRTYVYDSHIPKEAIDKEGEQLKITNISRYCEDEYMCVASNGIGNPANRKMKVTVQFPPEVDILTRRLLQYRGMETMLDCKIEANPFGTIVWKRKGKELSNNGKYGLDIFEDGIYRKTLSLRINNIEKEDYGEYTCSATNELGSDHGKMYLEEIDKLVTDTTTTTGRSLIWTDSRTTHRDYSDPFNPPKVKVQTYKPGSAAVSGNGIENSVASLVVVFITSSTALFLRICDLR